jgi:hypothetical protein
MKRTLFLTMFLTLMSFLLVTLAFAKDSPDKITIWGPSLTQPIEITDPDVLEGFDPWEGQFLDRSRDTVSKEPHVQEIYHVIFYWQANKDKNRVMYVFQYSPNPFGGKGFIYLPREGEPWHRVNGQTIIRSSGWKYASPAWDKLMGQTLENDTVSHNEARNPQYIQIVVPVIILIGVAATIWLFRRRYPLSTQN